MLLAVPVFAQPAPQAESALAQFLRARGFVAVALRPNALNQLEAEVEIEGEYRLRAVVNTAFSKTILDQAAVRKLGLPSEPTSTEMTGARGKQRLGMVRLQNLALGGHVLGAATVFTADLDQLVSRAPGAEPAQAVLGSDLLNRHEAILELPTSTLYLKPR